MHFTKIFIVLILSWPLGFWVYKGADGGWLPHRGKSPKIWFHRKLSFRDRLLCGDLNDLKVVTDRKLALKKSLRRRPSGNIKITNKSKDILDIQAVTLEFLNEAGKPIPYKADEKSRRFIRFGKFFSLKYCRRVLDVTNPTNAIRKSPLTR